MVGPGVAGEALSVEPLTLRPDVWFDSDDGPPVVESAFITGPAHLFGIATEPLQPHGGPTIVFINVSNEHRIGPNRLWVDLARRWARIGFVPCGSTPVAWATAASGTGKPGAIRVPENFDQSRRWRGIRRQATPPMWCSSDCAPRPTRRSTAPSSCDPAGCAINPIFSFSRTQMDAGQPT